MRTLVMLAFVSLLAGTTSAPAQPVAELRWFVTYGYGRSDFDMQQLRNLMSDFVEEYRDLGVPLQRQVNFPANHLHSVEVTRSEGLLRVGVGAAMSSSLAFAGYQDGAGLVRLRIKASMLTLYAHAGIRNLTFGAWGSTYFSLKAGPLIGKVESEEELTLYDYPQVSGKRSKEARVHPICVTAIAGLDLFPYDRVFVGVEAGYRFARSVDARVWDDRFIKQAEFGGLVASLTVGVVF